MDVVKVAATFEKRKITDIERPKHRGASVLGARVRVEITAAPSREPSILAHPPRVRRDAQGFLRRELKGHDGWSDQGVIEDVTRLASHGGLVLAATDVQAFLMGASDFDTRCWTDRAGLTTRRPSSSQRA